MRFPTLKSSLNRKIILRLLLVSVPLIVFCVISIYFLFRGSLDEQAKKHLNAIADKTVYRLERYANAKRGDAAVLSRAPSITKALQRLNRSPKGSAAHNTLRKQLQKNMLPFLEEFAEERHLYDILLVSTDGDVLISIEEESDLGTNLITGPFKNSRLREAWESAKTTLNSEITDFLFYEPSNDYAAFICAPIFSEKQIIGTACLQLENTFLHRLTADHASLGSTGEILTGSRRKDKILVQTPLRKVTNAQYRKLIDPTKQKHIPISRAVIGEDGSGKSFDYAGEEVIAA